MPSLTECGSTLNEVGACAHRRGTDAQSSFAEGARIVGRPNNYSLEIAARCQALVAGLADQIAGDPNLVDEYGGPLRTTFLLAMSTPMLVLPIERLFKPIVEKRPGVADDSALDMAANERVRDTLGPGRTFRSARFFEEGAWSFMDAVPRFAVAQEWPANIFDSLATAEAQNAAADAPAAAVLLTLRNALGHGGVAYLDANGRQSLAATNMLAFASYPAWNRKEELRLLRVSVEAYQRFLGRWADWLATSEAKEVLSAQGPRWFDEVA